MLNKATRLLSVFMLFALSITAMIACDGDGESSSPRFYPDMGDFYYGKSSTNVDYAEFYISWTDPVYDDPDFTGEPIYEHDFNVYDTSIYESCTSYSTLPDWYDDCPTAGFSDTGYIGFGYGSFNASAIAPLADYYGILFLHRVIGSQMYHQFCSWDSIWCLGTAQSMILISQFERDLYTGVQDYFSWRF